MTIEKSEIKEILENIKKSKSSEGLYDLFNKLGYSKTLTKNTKRKKDSFGFRKEESPKIKNIYSILSYGQDLNVFLIESETDSNSFIRSVFNTLDQEYLAFMLIVTTDYSKLTFVLPKTNSKDKTNKKLTKLETNLSDIKYTDIDILEKIQCNDESGYRQNWFNWQEAFNVEKVTEKFFCDYKSKFFELRNYLIRNKVDPKEAHEFTLSFLNRIMFIYFISKKGWLKETNFFNWYIGEYKKSQKITSKKDVFYELWVKQLFFKGLNNHQNEIEGIPEQVKKIIFGFPYLNGGLFKENDLDRKILINIKDSLFENILNFFESYNFTIKEDMPLDEQVAIDPQMIGYVYESLAQVADKIYNPDFDNNDLGIFYTPKIEVDFMCRRSIVEYLSNHCTDIPKENLYHFVFDTGDLSQLTTWLSNKNCEKIESKLDEISVVDPACGSGAFLVGTLNVLSELYNKINKYKKDKNDLTEFQLKKRIIQYSLYGVDVMPWAIHAAELRLWLQLVLDAKKEELTEGPLLPNLDLNLRVGDSLVQEIGGVYFNLNGSNLKPELKKKIDSLKDEKRNYFANSNLKKFSNSDKIKQEELKIFKEIIDEKIQELKDNLTKDNTTSQKTLTGMVLLDPVAQKIKEENFLEIKRLSKIKDALKLPEHKPFIWDLDFAEIFIDKKGFDIVIGNPPYVRQEAISPPGKLEKEITNEDKKIYKEKLQRSLKERYDGYLDKLSGRSDLYIYFYLHGLGLLNRKGTFCFITSNSWLDVDFGSELQEFLCKYVPIKTIYDNPKRSFSHAEVNTIIALFGAPTFQNIYYMGSLKSQQQDLKDSRYWPMLNNTAKFIMFKKSFEEVVNTKILLEIENVQLKEKSKSLTDLIKNIIKTDDYRAFPILQQDLLEDGWEYFEEKDKINKFSSGKYDGNKWGGKFLRAPEIILNIINSKKWDTISLFAVVKTVSWSREGIKDKVVLEKKKIVKEKIDYYLLNSPKDTSKIYITKENTKKVIVNSNLLITKPIYCPVLLDSAINDKFICRYCSSEIVFAHNFTGIVPFDYKQSILLCTLLNSTVSALFFENFGRKGLGQGALTLTTNDYKKIPCLLSLNILSNDKLQKINNIYNKIKNREIISIFEECGLDSNKPIREQEPKPLPDRAELDNIIFDELRLTKEERKEVYWSVCELVKQRLSKANSLSNTNKKCE